MSRHPFLCAAWIDAATAIYESSRHRLNPTDAAVRANFIITDVPSIVHSAPTLEGHLDTDHGLPVPKLGLLKDPSVTATMRYPVAKTLFLDPDQTTFLSAFMRGDIDIEGDITVLLDLEAGDDSSGGARRELAMALAGITA